SRHAERGFIGHSPGTSQVLARLGGDPQGILAVPLILRDKVAAILYCDSSQEEVPPSDADAVEILVSFPGKTIDLLTGAPKPAAPRGRPRPARAQPARPPPAPPKPRGGSAPLGDALGARARDRAGRRRGPRARRRPPAAATPPPRARARPWRRRGRLHRDVQRG